MNERRCRAPGRSWAAASILAAMALVLRLVTLGDRPVMHDESMFAYYAYVFFDTGRYTHLPILHGPTLMLASGALFAIFGDSIEENPSAIQWRYQPFTLSSSSL